MVSTVRLSAAWWIISPIRRVKGESPRGRCNAGRPAVAGGCCHRPDYGQALLTVAQKLRRLGGPISREELDNMGRVVIFETARRLILEAGRVGRRWLKIQAGIHGRTDARANRGSNGRQIEQSAERYV